MSGFPIRRMRRLRRTPAIRAMRRETRLAPDDFIYPLFVVERGDLAGPVSSMPGISRLRLGDLDREIESILSLVAVAWAGERGRVRASATPGRVAAAMGTWSKSRFSWHLRLLGRIGHTKHRQRAHHLRGPVQEAIDGA